jgi:hypothetical protein
MAQVSWALITVIATIAFGFAEQVRAASLDCSAFNIDAKASIPLNSPGELRNCKTRMSNGFPIPDPSCTPGAINPTVTLEVLRDTGFRTACVRDKATRPKEKATTYDSYGIEHPEDNSGVAQICELDHLISLEIGGADTLDNIWPQCGPDQVTLVRRYFKQKDLVENYLAKQVREGTMNLSDAQRGIASDWTQYLDQAKEACSRSDCE